MEQQSNSDNNSQMDKDVFNSDDNLSSLQLESENGQNLIEQEIETIKELKSDRKQLGPQKMSSYRKIKYQKELSKQNPNYESQLSSQQRLRDPKKNLNEAIQFKKQMFHLARHQKKGHHKQHYVQLKQLPKIKLLYKPGIGLPDLSNFTNQNIEVNFKFAFHYQIKDHIGQEFLKRNIWGNETYSSNSDIVCILQHTGKISLFEQIPKNYDSISVIFKVTKRKNYKINKYYPVTNSKKSTQLYTQLWDQKQIFKGIHGNYQFLNKIQTDKRAIILKLKDLQLKIKIIVIFQS